MPKDTVVMEGVDIVFRNFTGKAGLYNKEGDRNFAVLLDEDIAQKMFEDDWHVKWLKPREDELAENPDAQPQAYLPVALKYDAGRPPTVYQISSRGKTRLKEELVETLDWVNIVNVDLIVRPYTWEVNGRGGVKAYLQALYITIEEDPLAEKYADMEEQ